MNTRSKYQTVFNRLRDNGTLDNLRDTIVWANAHYTDQYNFAWIQHINLWRELHRAYTTDTTLYSIPLPALKKFRKLVTEYTEK